VIRSDRSLPRFAAPGLLALALSLTLVLGGCGRKGPLDPPPGGAPAVSQTGAAHAGGQSNSNAQGNSKIGGGAGRSSLPVIKGEDRTIPLDALLN